MVCDREAGFVTGNIKAHHFCSCKTLDKIHRFPALFFGKMPQRTQDDPGFHTGLQSTFPGSVVHSLHHFIAMQSFCCMQERCKTDLCINYIILFQLLKQIKCY
jgi:hypothetical protein